MLCKRRKQGRSDGNMPWYADDAQFIPLASCSECNLQLKGQTGLISLLLLLTHKPKSPLAKWFRSLHIWHRISNTSAGLLKDCTAGIVAESAIYFYPGYKNCYCVVVKRDRNQTFCSCTLSVCLGIKGSCIKRETPDTCILGILVWIQHISTPNLVTSARMFRLSQTWWAKYIFKSSLFIFVSDFLPNVVSPMQHHRCLWLAC